MLKHNINVITSISEAIQKIDCRVAMLLAMTMLPFKTLAQDYVPPPLFEAPPQIQKMMEEEKDKNTPVIFPKPSTKPAIKPVKKSVPIAKKYVPPPLVIEEESNGVVKGPKTMPSVPTKSVETEILFAPENIAKPSPKQNQEETISSDNNAQPEIIPPLPAFKTLSGGELQTTLYFVSEVKEMSHNNRAIVKHLILPELQKSPSKRLLIQAYASPKKDTLDGDRRTALSRALNIRRFLIEQEIESSRLDVRSVGAQTNEQPLDRVELIIR